MGKNYKLSDSNVMTYFDNNKYYYQRFGEFEDEELFNPNKKKKLKIKPAVPKKRLLSSLGENSINGPLSTAANKRSSVMKKNALSARLNVN